MDGATGSRRRNESSASAFKPHGAAAERKRSFSLLHARCLAVQLRLKIRMSRAHINILGLTKIET